jgi:hypothetical protein
VCVALLLPLLFDVMHGERALWHIAVMLLLFCVFLARSVARRREDELILINFLLLN